MYTCVTGQTITQANKKTILDAEGLTAYNACLVDADISGKACINEGHIACFDIVGQNLESDRVKIKYNCIGIHDDTGEKIVFKSSGLDTVASLAGASCCAFNITNSCCATCQTNLTCNQSSNLTLYYQQCSAGVACMEATATCTAGRNFGVTANKNYVVNASIKVSDTYALCANDNDPAGDCVTRTYTRCGGYCVSGNTSLYDCTNTLLLTNTWTTGNLTPIAGFGGNNIICTIPSQTVLITQPSVYMVNNYRVCSDAYQSALIKCYTYDANDDRYIQCASSNATLNLTNCIKVQPNCLQILGNIGVAQISTCGGQYVYATDNYWRYDPALKKVINYSALDVYGNLYVTGNTVVNSDMCLSSGFLCTTVSCDNQYAAQFCNTFASATGMGVKIRAGAAAQTSGCHNFLKFFNNCLTGQEVGALRNNAGTIQLCSASDCRLKCCISDANMNALSIINELPVRQYQWIGDETQTTQIGFIAQEAKDLGICKFAGYDQELDRWGISDTALIPYLVKAVQQLTGCVTELKDCIQGLK
jgi:hypothetical protein